MSRNFFIAAVSMMTLLSSSSTMAKEITVEGHISLGSSLGLISNGKVEYVYGGTTRNLAILHKGCPISMGKLVPCKVRFEASGNNVTAILSAKLPSFGGRLINKPGSVFDAYVCDQKSAVGYDAKPGCDHFEELMVQIVAINRDVAKLKWNGQIKYSLSQRVLINCQGTSISLASYIGRNFPSGIKSC